VAGMEGALASALGGLVGIPVVAVPTSIGYGANFKGVSALLAMVNSCASNVAVVNIDNRFGGGFCAALVSRTGMLSREEPALVSKPRPQSSRKAAPAPKVARLPKSSN